VVVVHDTVAHGWPERNAEGLGLLYWKLTPMIVIVAVPETWAFIGRKEEMQTEERNEE
jgi:hypothetical protein